MTVQNLRTEIKDKLIVQSALNLDDVELKRVFKDEARADLYICEMQKARDAGVTLDQIFNEDPDRALALVASEHDMAYNALLIHDFNHKMPFALFVVLPDATKIYQSNCCDEAYSKQEFIRMSDDDIFAAFDLYCECNEECPEKRSEEKRQMKTNLDLT